MRSETDIEIEGGMEDWEEDEDETNFRQTRLCRADNGSVSMTGIFFPNFPLNDASLDLTEIRPVAVADQDNSLSHGLAQLAPQIVTAGKATGLLYIGIGTPGNWDDSKSTSYSIIQTANNRTAIMTCLHGLMTKNKFPISFFHCYVVADLTKAHLDLMNEFLAWKKDLFVEVQVRSDLLAERADYITNLLAQKTDTLVNENLDAEFNLQPHPVLDMLFFTVPNHMQHITPLSLATAPPVQGSRVFLIAYHSLYPKRRADKEYMKTFTPSGPLAAKVLNPNRSLTIGKAEATYRGTAPAGIATATINTAHQASGGALLDDNLHVFALAQGGFFDIPPVKKGTFREGPKAWTELDRGGLQAAMLCNYDLVLPEATDNHQSKNRSVFLTIYHSGAQALLAKV